MYPVILPYSRSYDLTLGIFHNQNSVVLDVAAAIRKKMRRYAICTLDIIICLRINHGDLPITMIGYNESFQISNQYSDIFKSNNILSYLFY